MFDVALVGGDIFQGGCCGANFIYCFSGYSGGGRIYVATTVSIEIERVAHEQLCVYSVYARLSCT
jgi:hypothetical protein